MAKRRKTVKLEKLIERTNRELSRDDAFATVEYKRGVFNFMTGVLMEFGVYNGYTYNGDFNYETDRGTDLEYNVTFN